MGSFQPSSSFSLTNLGFTLIIITSFYIATSNQYVCKLKLPGTLESKDSPEVCKEPVKNPAPSAKNPLVNYENCAHNGSKACLSFSPADTPPSDQHIVVELNWPKSLSRMWSMQLEQNLGEGAGPHRPPLYFRRRAMRRARRWLVNVWWPPTALEELRRRLGTGSMELSRPESLDDQFFREVHSEAETDESQLRERDLDRLTSPDFNNDKQWLVVSLSNTLSATRMYFRALWAAAGHWSGLTPEAYFKQAAAYGRALPIARWLAQAGIYPNDFRLVERSKVEDALARHLGSKANFRLICYTFPDYNPTRVLVEENEWHPWPLRYMLFAVRVCFDSVRTGGDADETEVGRLVACSDRATVSEELLDPGMEVCSRPKLTYYRTV